MANIIRDVLAPGESWTPGPDDGVLDWQSPTFAVPFGHPVECYDADTGEAVERVTRYDPAARSVERLPTPLTLELVGGEMVVRRVSESRRLRFVRPADADTPTIVGG